MLREELQLLQEQGSYVGEVVKPMDKKKVLVKVHPEGKFVVDLDKNIDINDVTANSRVALRNESYTLHKILPNKVCIIIINDILVFMQFLHTKICVSSFCLVLTI
jgi:26S proteasome regulatory subunit T6